MKKKLLLFLNLFFLLISLNGKAGEISELAGSSCLNPIVVEVYTAPLENFEISSENFPNSVTGLMITPASPYIHGNNIIFQFELTGTSYVNASITGSNTGIFIFGTCPSLEAPAATLASAGGWNGASLNNIVLEAGSYFFVTGTWPEPQYTDKVISLSAQLVPSDPVLTAQPDPLFTGYAAAGVNSAKGQLTITNSGAGQAVVNQSDITVTGDDASVFSVAPANSEITFPVSLGFQEQLVLIVTFSPAVEGLKEATLQINYHADSEPLLVPISGNGYLAYTTFLENFSTTTAPHLPVKWSRILGGPEANVDVTDIGVPLSPPWHSRLSNAGNTTGTAILVSPVVTNLSSSRVKFAVKMSVGSHTDNIQVGFITDINDPATFTLVQSVPVSGNIYSYKAVSFADATDIEFPANASIAFRHSMTANFRVFYVDNITYEPQPTGPEFFANKNQINFGNTVVINTTVTQTMTIANHGIGVMTLNENDFSISGPDAEYFDLEFPSDMQWPLSLAELQSHTFNLSFSPTEEREYNATLAIEDNIADKAINNIPLQGTGYDPTITPPFLFDFVGAFPPLDWIRRTGVLTETTTLNPTTGGWVASKFANQQSLPVNNATKVNLFFTRDFWLITPPINLGDGQTGYGLSFDLAKTGWNNTNPADMGPEQSLRVLVKSKESQYWTPADVVQQWTHEDYISHTGQNVTIDLSEFSGTVQIAFYGKSVAPGDVDIHVTNVEVNELTYYTVTFNVSDTNGNLIDDATVNFDNEILTEGPYVFENLLSGVYQYQVSKPGFIPQSGNVSVTDEDVVINISLATASTVNFTVTDGINPVANANISIFDNQNNNAGAIITNELGQASQILSPGDYTYDVFAYTFNSLTDESFEMAAEDLNLTVVLTRPESVQLPVFENFNIQQLPEGWAIADLENHTANQSWKFVQSYNGNSIDGTAFLFVDSDDAGSGVHLNAMIYTPLIDASDIQGGLMLEFDHFYRHTGSGFGKVEVWDGNQWQQVVIYNSTTGSWSQPQHASFNISDHANENLQIRFHYDDASSWAWWWAIDNISIKDVMQYELTLDVVPEGSGTVTGGGMHNEGEQVTVEATPNEGYEFVNWTDHEDAEVSADAIYIFNMPSHDLLLKANFQVIETFTLDLVAVPENAGTLTGGGEYEEATEVNVVAVANDGYIFLNWMLNDAVISTDASFTFVMPGNDVTLTATFEEEVVTYTLNLVVQPANAGVATGAGEYEQGESVSITAAANDGYEFVNWTDENDAIVSTESDFVYTMPAHDFILTANFMLETSTASVSAPEARIYPNPARDHFTVTSEVKINRILIYDLTGSIVLEQEVDSENAVIRHNFPAGLYLVNLITSHGNIIKKLVIHE